jgi:hypothetical protein
MSAQQYDIPTNHVPRRWRLSAIPALALGFSLILFSNSQAKDGGWDFQPYHIQINIAIDTNGGLAEQLTANLPTYLSRRIAASLAPLWTADVHVATGRERDKLFKTIPAAEPKPLDIPAGTDKVILVAIRATPETFELSAREFDRYVQRWSPPLHRSSRQETYLPEQVFSLVYHTFSPLAKIELDAKDARKVILKPRGAALPRKANAVPFAKPGDTYAPFLRRTTRGGELEKKDGLIPVAWTYIEATELKGNTIVARFQSARSRPIMLKRQGRIEPVAIAIHTEPDNLTLRLHSRTAAEKRLVGYEVFTQRWDDKTPTPVGLTNTSGEISIPPGKSPIQFLLVKHGGALFAKIPVLAGEKDRIDIPLPDDDSRLAAEASLASVREDLVDVVARRNILISRARSKIDKKDYAGAQELLRSLNDLPSFRQFKNSLDTSKKSLRSEDPQMQRRIDRLFESTEALLTQYLDLKPINQINDELREAQSKGGSKSSEAAGAKKS